MFEARGQLAEAEARVLVAEAAIAEVRFRIENAAIAAPFAGTVLDVLASPGEFIAAGAPVARILDTASLEVEARVPARYIAAISEGEEVRATLEDGYRILHRLDGGIAHARVNESFLGAREQVRTVLDILELEGRGLVNRRDDGAVDVLLDACMHCLCFDTHVPDVFHIVLQKNCLPFGSLKKIGSIIL